MFCVRWEVADAALAEQHRCMGIIDTIRSTLHYETYESSHQNFNNKIYNIRHILMVCFDRAAYKQIVKRKCILTQQPVFTYHIFTKHICIIHINEHVLITNL